MKNLQSLLASRGTSCTALALMSLMATTAMADNVGINETNFPDATFRSYVSETFDKDKDGQLSTGEIDGATSINLYYKSVESFKGLEYFTALTNLNCGSNKLTTLDVSNNTALKTLYCYKNQLTELDLSHNTALTELSCYNNKLTSLDLSHNTALNMLYCDKNNLISLDLSQNTALVVTSIDCSGNERNLGKVDFNGFTVEGLDISKVSNVSGAILLEGEFVPTNDNVTEITYSYNTQCVVASKAQQTFKLIVEKDDTAPSAEEALVALMGDVKYVSGNYNVSVNKDGDIIYENVVDDITRNITELFTISLKDDGNYVTNVLKNIQFIFYVEDQKVTKIEAYDKNKLYITFLPEQKTPTAISAPAAEKAVKAYKTIENGEIVIVKDGERFNLRGAKIK